jgi:hypothetical protein
VKGISKAVRRFVKEHREIAAGLNKHELASEPRAHMPKCRVMVIEQSQRSVEITIGRGLMPVAALKLSRLAAVQLARQLLEFPEIREQCGDCGEPKVIKFSRQANRS